MCLIGDRKTERWMDGMNAMGRLVGWVRLRNREVEWIEVKWRSRVEWGGVLVESCEP